MPSGRDDKKAAAAAGKEAHPLLGVDTREQREWVQKAQQSDCARHIDALFKDKPAELVKGLKEEMFKQIFICMGDELDPEDLAHAVVIHYQKFNPYTACIFTVLTLGLFCLFRPRDDDTVVVLTKQDRRVLTHKVERTNFCEGRNSGALLMFIRYLLILLLILSMPAIMWVMIWNGTHPEGTNMWEQLVHEEEEVVLILRAKHRLSGYLYAMGLMIIIFFLYTNIPTGTHGTRSHQNHAATNLSMGQFTLSGGNFRRRAALRLFFGKYPRQPVLDTVGVMAMGHVAGPVSPSELISGSRWTTPAVITVLTLLLSFITIIDMSFSWVDRSIAMGHAAYRMQFCVFAPKDPEAGAKYCTEDRCKIWSVENDVRGRFCRGVEWFDHKSDADDHLMCLHYGGTPCCGGCERGSLLVSGWVQVFREGLAMVGDIGTLIFSYMAAKIALSSVKATGHVEIVTERRHIFTKQTANFDLTRPLMLHFLETLFDKASTSDAEDEAGAGAGERITAQDLEDPGVQIHGVKCFETDSAAREWDEFLKEGAIVMRNTKQMPMELKVKVPKRLLGIPDAEEVLGAWAEIPAEFSLAGLLPAIQGALGIIQHAVILTDRRIFYVRVQQRSMFLKMMGKNLRVDTFRHDRHINFGRLNHTVRPFIYRLLKAPWKPGNVYLQAHFGVLGLVRQHGNALSVHHVISQLAKSSHFISQQEVEAAGVSWAQCQASLEGSLKRKSGKVFTITRQPDDVLDDDPDMYLSQTTEAPIFTWSFKERGRWFSAFNINTDVVVTTGRVFIWSRGFYKDFDCRTCLCWSCCWCSCFYKLLRNDHLLTERVPSSMSFMTLPSILSFSTDTHVDSPICCDPIHPPWRLPCYEEFCTSFTNCVSCRTSGCILSKENCKKCPGRTGPRTQLFLTWRLKQRVQDEDLEVLASLRPCALPDVDDDEGEEGGTVRGLQGYTSGYIQANAEGALLPEVSALTYEQQSKYIKMLWKVIGVALRAFDKIEQAV